MPRSPRLLVACLLMGLHLAPASAQTVTVIGEVVSVRCYLQNRANVGKTGYVCAVGDVKWEGNPPGLLTSDGKLYQLAGPLVADNNAKVVPHLGARVSVSGVVAVKNGMPILTAGDLTPVAQ